MAHIPEPPESPRLLRPRRVGEILIDALDLYRRHWQNLIVIVAAIVVPLSIVQVLVANTWIHDAFTQEKVQNGVVIVNGTFIANALGSLVVGITTILMWTVLSGAITRAAAGTFLGRDLEIGESYRFGLARFWSIVLVAVLSVLAIVGGFILLIVPGFIVLAHLACTMPVLVIEGRRGRSALGRSWDLVRGFGWPVFGIIIIAGLATGIVSSVLTAPFGDNWAARSITSSIASAITMPYTALVGVFIYLDLRVRKEQYSAADLERDLASNAT